MNIVPADRRGLASTDDEPAIETDLILRPLLAFVSTFFFIFGGRIGIASGTPETEANRG
jgi:hypothetical protein